MHNYCTMFGLAIYVKNPSQLFSSYSGALPQIALLRRFLTLQIMTSLLKLENVSNNMTYCNLIGSYCICYIQGCSNDFQSVGAKATTCIYSILLQNNYNHKLINTCADSQGPIDRALAAQFTCVYVFIIIL